MTVPETTTGINGPDPDCQRCRGGGCEWCGNTGRAMAFVPLSDANELDAVVHALGIEDSEITPAEAVKVLVADIHQERATVAAYRGVADMLMRQIGFLNGDRKKAWEGAFLARLAGAVADGRKGCMACAGTMMVAGCSPEPHIPGYPERCPDCDPDAPSFAPMEPENAAH